MLKGVYINVLNVSKARKSHFGKDVLFQSTHKLVQYCQIHK